MRNLPASIVAIAVAIVCAAPAAPTRSDLLLDSPIHRLLVEAGQGARGWSIDDPYFEWSEQHPADQQTGSINDCNAIGGKCAEGVCTIGKTGAACTTDAECVRRAGGNPAARPCGTVAFERMYLHECSTGVKVSLADSSTAAVAGTQGCAAGAVPVNVRSAEEPSGEVVCLAPVSGGQYEGTALISAVNDQDGILFVDSAAGENVNIIVSYMDPECDQDGDGRLGENALLDLDGDGVPNFGADNDNCYDPMLITDLFNPAGVPQLDVNGSGAISSEDCPPASDGQFLPSDPAGRCTAEGCAAGPADRLGKPCTRNSDCEHHGRSPRNGQCDWDNDGLGDICDNCPAVPNNDQRDVDGDGVGDLCEENDIDRDTVPDATDNCPTLYNPGQAGSVIRGSVCDDTQDRDGDGVIEINDNCPNETERLENGVPAPPVAATYNPAQEDTDADGIGDRCDGEDFDGDGVTNHVDNCPTIYNAADPVFRVQADSDFDGLGDDRANLDIRPGAQDYCDPDSDDDDNDGAPDDLIQFLAELDCNYTQFGMGRVASLPSVVGSLILVSVSMTDDGSSDFLCRTGDPNPYNDDATIEPCAQESTLDTTPGNDASCDTPAPATPGDYCVANRCVRGTPASRGSSCATDADCRQSNDGHCAATPDGIADPGELAQIALKLSNASVTSMGAARTLTSLTIGMRATTPAVGCVPKGQTRIFNDCASVPSPLTSIPAGGTVFCTTPGALSFIVDTANPGPGRSSAAAVAEAGFALTAQADGMEGYAPLQTFRFFVDLDTQHYPRIATQCPGGAPGELCEDFDTERNGTPGYQFTRMALSASPTDPLRADGDLTDDVLGFTMDTGPSPTGTNGQTCAKDVGRFATCTPVPEENDWHLHSVDADTVNTGYDPPGRSGISAPDGGKAHSGIRSMHWGRHTDPTTTLGDTSRFRQIAAFVIDTQNDPNIPGLVPGTASKLEFWHMISVPDDENAGSGFFGNAFGGAQAHLSLLGADGKFERWQTLTPSVNGYDDIIQGTVSICEFDPGDDRLFPADETMCNRGRVWTDIGDVFGTDATCMVDTDGNDPAHKDCGATTSQGPGFTERGTLGQGVWAKSVLDLSPFAGRVARVRFIAMEGGGWSFGTSRSFLEPMPGNNAYQYYDGDDGWWIDDIRLTDLRRLPSSIGPDTVTGLTPCVTGDDISNCGTIIPAIASSSALGLPTDPSGRRLPTTGTHVPGQLIALDARGSAATGPECLNGLLLFQWDEIDATTGAVTDTIQGPSPEGKTSVAPGHDTTYRVRIKCSSDTACAATRDVRVVVRDLVSHDEVGQSGSSLPADGALILNVTHPTPGFSGGINCPAGTETLLTWESVPQTAGIQAGYDLYRRTLSSLQTMPRVVDTSVAPPVFSDASCLSGNVAQVLPAGSTVVAGPPDTACPTPGQAFIYQVGHRKAATGPGVTPLLTLPIGITSGGLSYVPPAAGICP